jgi:hypothetical protein
VPAAVALLLAAAALLPGTVSAGKKEEKPYALISGTVWAPDSRPAWGVKVKIRRADQNKAKWEAVSDRRGEFAVRVPAGAADYILTADLKTKGPKPEAKVHVENDERVDVSLHLTE